VAEIEAAIAARVSHRAAPGVAALWWANPPALKSVPDLDHVHVATKGPPLADAGEAEAAAAGSAPPRARL
jgi:hypothetical protein